jgi:hypothetical protein
MFAKITIVFLAIVALASAFAPSSRFARRSYLADVNTCDEYKRDKKGRCPGDTGYVSFVKQDVPKDFAVSTAARNLHEEKPFDVINQKLHFNRRRLSPLRIRQRKPPNPPPRTSTATSTRWTRRENALEIPDTSAS